MTFDRLLTTAVLNPGNWLIRENITARVGQFPANAAGNSITCSMGGGIPDIGPDVVNYSPPPFDVLSRFGVAAPAFADFPLAVLP